MVKQEMLRSVPGRGVGGMVLHAAYLNRSMRQRRETHLKHDPPQDVVFVMSKSGRAMDMYG